MRQVVPLQSRIDGLNFQKLEEIAKLKGVSISMLIRMVLINFIEGSNVLSNS
jgi:hypothetical protein